MVLVQLLQDHSLEGFKDQRHEGWDEMVVDVVRGGGIVLRERGRRVGEFYILIDLCTWLHIICVIGVCLSLF